jgi:hypothetical protein
VIISFHCARDLAQGLGGSRDEPEDAAKWEMKRASDEQTQAWRERDRCVIGRAPNR